MVDHKVDLIVIEGKCFEFPIRGVVEKTLISAGMGRSLHTNLNSKFKCESLKLAVIKVRFLN